MKRLKRLLAFSISLLCLMSGANNVYAGYYADKLSQCLVTSANEEDRKNLAKWVFSVIVQHPDIKQYSNLTTEQQKALEKTTANLFERLMTKDCRDEFVSVLKYEQEQGIFIAFKALGEVSMMTLMSNPEVQKAATNFSEQIDTKAIEELTEQAKTK